MIDPKRSAQKGFKHLISVNFSDKSGDINMSTFYELMCHTFISTQMYCNPPALEGKILSNMFPTVL